MPTFDCLKYVVGLSNSNCNCFTPDRPADYNTSLSGLFVSELVPLSFAGNASDCEQGGVWDILDTSRKLGIDSFLSDISSYMGMSYQNRFTPFKGYVGGKKISSSFALMSPGNYVGQKLRPYQIKGGIVSLDGVDLALSNFSPPMDVTVHVYSNADFSSPLGSVVVTLTSTDSFASGDFAAPVIMTLGDVDANGNYFADPDLEYYVVYQVHAGVRYANNALFENGCGGCGTATHTNTREYPYGQYFVPNGIESSTLQGLDSSPSKISNLGMGLRLRLSVGCDSEAWLCQLTYDQTAAGAGINKPMARMVAHAIQRSIAIKVCDIILASNNINSVTILETEKLYQKKGSLTKQYLQSIQWIADNYPSDLTDCFNCRQTYSLASLKS